MDFDQFKLQVVDEMRERFPDLDIGVQAVSKLQGESYTGLAVSPAGSNVAATMNLDYVFKRVEDGMPMETALHNIEKQVAEIAGSMPQFDTRALMDYGQMKEKLTLQMIPLPGMRKSFPRFLTELWRTWLLFTALRWKVMSRAPPAFS